MVAVVGEVEPATPGSVADLGEVHGIGSGDLLDVTESLAPGTTRPCATVWLGTFDGAGRFRGWVADPITMPEAGTIRSEEPIDDTISTGITPDTFGFVTCPSAPVSWISTFEETCASWESTGLECNDDGVLSDVCGCTTGWGGGWGAGSVLGLLVARRRRPLTR